MVSDARDVSGAFGERSVIRDGQARHFQLSLLKSARLTRTRLERCGRKHGDSDDLRINTSGGK
jgi:hypothetical protein